MRAVVQRVKKATVRIDGEIRAAIDRGLLALVGVEKGDGDGDIDYIAAKLLNMRVFEDKAGKMNLDAREAGGRLLLVSQFTLLGDIRKGKRPSFDNAERPEEAKVLYNRLVRLMKERHGSVESGEFQTYMEVELINDGPVTILLDSRKRF